jgi:hypothetical protein
MVNELQARLHSLYNGRTPIGAVGPQMAGLERYRVIATGEQLYALLEAADRIGELEIKLRLTEGAFKNTRIRELEAENARLNMEMVAYREKLSPQDAAAMVAVINALYAEKSARGESNACSDFSGVRVRQSDGDSPNG